MYIDHPYLPPPPPHPCHVCENLLASIMVAKLSRAMCSSALTSETFYRPEPVIILKTRSNMVYSIPVLSIFLKNEPTFDPVFDQYLKSNCLIELMKQLLRNFNGESAIQENSVSLAIHSDNTGIISSKNITK